MKKYLPRILFVVVLLASVLYLIPNFTVKYKDYQYSFTNLRSLFNSEKKASGARLQGVADTYKYVIESVNPVEKQSDWDYILPKDQKLLERRVESFIGNEYEVRLDKVNNKAVFSVYALRNLGDSVSVLTTNNSEFSISEVESTSATTDQASQEAPKTTKLNLKRSEFGEAVINASQQDNGSGQTGVVYQVKMPIGILTPEKINLIKTKAYSQLTVFVGGKEYSASFLPNTTGVITHLVLNQIQTVDEAAAVRTYLNTDSYYLGYQVNAVQSVNKYHHVWKIVGLTALTFVIAVLVNLLTIRSLTGKKAFLIAAYLIMGIAALKLFGVALSEGVIMVLMLITLLALFNARNTIFIGLGAALLLTQLFGYLYYLGLNWTQLIIIIVTSALIWSTNYVKKSQK